MSDEEMLKQMFDKEAYKENPLEAFRSDLDKIKPRFFDTYILPAFMLWFAYSSKRSMGRWPRRMLFTGGMYMLYRNARIYRRVISNLRSGREMQGPTPVEREAEILEFHRPRKEKEIR
jgi:hypothetical protein